MYAVINKVRESKEEGIPSRELTSSSEKKSVVMVRGLMSQGVDEHAAATKYPN